MTSDEMLNISMSPPPLYIPVIFNIGLVNGIRMGLLLVSRAFTPKSVLRIAVEESRIRSHGHLLLCAKESLPC
jgi:hypothetical protein